MNPFHLKPCIYWRPSKLLRLRYRWALIYLFISASLVILFCVHRGHQEQLIEYRAKFLFVVADETSPTIMSTAVAATADVERTSTFKSTCSAAADRRGPHQNVISYSIYGDNFYEPNFYRKYLKPFTETLRTIPIRYPGKYSTMANYIIQVIWYHLFVCTWVGWVVRIYHELRRDDMESWKILNHILDLGTNSSRDHIDLCNATEIIRNRNLGDLFEMTWRWVL